MNMRIKLYAYLWKLFRDREFAISDFDNSFESPNSRKILSDLSKNGFVKRIEKGKYRTIAPQEFIENITDDAEKYYKIPEETKMEYAFSERNAVLIWSQGYYWTGFKNGFYPIFIRVNKNDLKKWVKFFREKMISFILKKKKPRETLAGVFFIIEPVEKVKKTKKGEYWVVPLEETIEFCKKNIFLYEPALEYLYEKYKIRKTEKQYVRS